MSGSNLISFVQESDSRNPIISNFIRIRNKRPFVANSNVIFFESGDILSVTFRNKNIIYSFEGICMSKRKKTLLEPEVSFILRNVLSGIGIECTYSYYYNRVYNKLEILDYKRKRFIYNRSKLFHIRYKSNRASRVK